MTYKKKWLRAGCPLVLVILLMTFFIGCPWREERIWVEDFGDIQMTIKHSFTRSFELYKVTLTVRDGDDSSDFYVEHQDTYWWNAHVIQVSPGRFLIKKNGFNQMYYNHSAKETIHLRNFIDRFAMESGCRSNSELTSTSVQIQ